MNVSGDEEMKKYTIKQAVRDTLQEIEPGVKIYGYHICNYVRYLLKKNGRHIQPLDSTIMRRYREVHAIYGVHALNNAKSEYRKTLQEETA